MIETSCNDTLRSMIQHTITITVDDPLPLRDENCEQATQTFHDAHCLDKVVVWRNATYIKCENKDESTLTTVDESESCDGKKKYDTHRTSVESESPYPQDHDCSYAISEWETGLTGAGYSCPKSTPDEILV